MFDTIDRNQPVATCSSFESFRSSMTVDFLRQRFALTRVYPPSLPSCFFLLVHPPRGRFLASRSTVPPFVPFAAETRVPGRDRLTTKKTRNRAWDSFIGNTFLWVRNGTTRAPKGFSISRRSNVDYLQIVTVNRCDALRGRSRRFLFDRKPLLGET